ncbi:MAG: hypothetical protein K6L80_04620 [Agarilytica sp.]
MPILLKYTRLLLNFELMRSGYLPIIIKAEDRLNYYQALDLACAQGDYSRFVEQVNKLSVERFELLLSLVEGA